MIVPAFSKAFQQLGEPGSRRIVLGAVAVTLVLFIALVWIIVWLLGDLALTGWDWLDSLLEFGGVLVIIVALAFTFPAVSSVFISLYLEDIAQAVEEKHYPDDPPGRSADIKASLALSLRFAGVMIGLNLLCLPLYLILIFMTPLNLLLFYALNGYLLSREYFELVGARHLAPRELQRTRRRHQGRIWLAGAVIAFMLTIPILNLVAPIVATAAMVHMFKALELYAPEPGAEMPSER